MQAIGMFFRAPPAPSFSLFFKLLLGMIKQFLRDVDWGEIDYLIVDTPPGTSDEHISIVQFLSSARVDGAVIITTPQVRYGTPVNGTKAALWLGCQPAGEHCQMPTAGNKPLL